ncbi:MAG: type II toxin-antitoxin system RelE/ParE family toxin [Rhodospirillales bacterium]
MRIRLSPKAKADLADIWDYSKEEWGEDRAGRYLDGLGDRMIWLAAHTSLWKPRDDLAEELFSYPQESHVIYFREVAGAIEIVRILHQRMDVAQRL